MQSFTDLNNYSDISVSFTSANEYILQWGNNLGNISIIESEGSIFNIPKQLDLIDAQGLTRDLLLTLSFSNGAAVTLVRYDGIDPAINVVFDGVSGYAVFGIKSVAQYNDIFDNLSIGITPSFVGTFNFIVSFDDQLGDPLQQWQVNVTAELSPIFVTPPAVGFSEDQSLSITNVEIIENFLFATNYSVTIIPQDPAKIQLAFAPGNTPANSLSITNESKASINAALANLVLIPRPDFDQSTYFDTSVTREYDSTNAAKRTIVNCIVSHPDFSSPIGYAWNENANPTIIGNSEPVLAITDEAVGKSYTCNITIDPPSMGNLFSGNTNLGNTVTYSGNLPIVNANIATLTFQGNSNNLISGNVIYQQTQSTDNILQGNISIPLDYQDQAIHIFSNIAKPIGTGLASNGAIQGGSATANVDYWGYSWNSYDLLSNGITYTNYAGTGLGASTVSTGSAQNSSFRQVSVFRYGPLGLRVVPSLGIRSRPESRAAGSAGYIGFWIRLAKTHLYTTYMTVRGVDPLAPTSGVGTWGSNYERGYLMLISYNGSLYWATRSGRIPIGPTYNSGFGDPFVSLGPNPPVGEWTHVAFQMEAGTPTLSGTQVFSAWRDGIPRGFFNITTQGFPTETSGQAWHGKSDIGSINAWWLGAPNQAPSLITDTTFGYNDSINKPRADFYIDDIVIRDVAPRPVLRLGGFIRSRSLNDAGSWFPGYWANPPFTQMLGPQRYGIGNVTQLVAGI